MLPKTGTMNLRYPVLFVHGLFSSNRTWKKTARVLAEEYDLVPGGVLSAKGANGEAQPKPADFYLWNFSSNHSISYRRQAEELCEGIALIRQVNGVDKVVLVGHSMGGLAARAVIQLLDRQDVHALITLGTPHYGSPLALLRESTHGEARRVIGKIQKLLMRSERAGDEKAGLFRRMFRRLFRISNEAQREIDDFFSSEAFIELAPGSAALEELNRAPLPDHIHYAFITGSLTGFSAFASDSERANYARVRRFFVRAAEKITQGLAGKYLTGAYDEFRAYAARYAPEINSLDLARLIESDGAVPVVSQILAHFRNPPPVAAVLPVFAAHTRLTKRPAKIFQALAVCGVVGPREHWA